MFELYPGDTVLLCTDGLWGPLSDEQIVQELIVERSAQDSADALVQLALAAGSDDNITLQVLRIESRNNNPRPYAPPGTALQLSASASRSQATQPSPAFNSGSVLAASKPPRSALNLLRKLPLLHYVVMAMLCLCLAGDGGYFLLRSSPAARSLVQAALKHVPTVLKAQTGGSGQNVSSDNQTICNKGQDTQVDLLACPAPSVLPDTPVSSTTMSRITITNNTAFLMDDLNWKINELGANEHAFISAVDKTCDRKLASKASCYRYFSFTPRGIGPRTATIVVTSTSQQGSHSAQVTLTGNGVASSSLAPLVKSQPQQVRPPNAQQQGCAQTDKKCLDRARQVANGAKTRTGAATEE